MEVDLVVRNTCRATPSFEEMRRHSGQVDLQCGDVIRTLRSVSFD
jgi:hypothetical protein